MKPHLKNFVYRVGAGALRKAKFKAPIKTGDLKRDIQIYDDKLDSLLVSIGNSAGVKYAKFVHEGTKPHMIKVKKMKSLANKEKGQFFGKQVRHPGTKANPYLKNAVSEFLKSSDYQRATNALGNKIGEEYIKDIKKALKVK
ncbi:hypothetical protein BFG05_05995 [Campylobacter pinnipediorum subsp. pinnipediorum]|nr:hypothetical protein BFG05_05995 [Campylobacter pinnipediorum subsp. pinnipediorum]